MTQQSNADTCDAQGICADNGSSECTPYVCKGSGCLPSCGGDGDCQAPNKCYGGACSLGK